MILRARFEPDVSLERGRTWIRWASRLLLAVGLVLLGVYAYVVTESGVYQDFEEWSFERNLQGRDASWTDYTREVIPRRLAGRLEAIPADKSLGESGTAATDVAGLASRSKGKMSAPVASASRIDPKLVGKILIPRIQISAMVREGVDSRTLRRAVGHVPGTAMPGQPGNVALAAHRDSFFRNLRGIKKDDRIILQTLQGDYEYMVDSLKIVSPKDVSVIQPTDAPAVTLVTCYPFNYVGHAPKRYIVRARQVASPTEAVASN